MMKTINQSQANELNKAVKQEPYNIEPLKEGFEKEEDLITDVEIAMLAATIGGNFKLSEEHKEDIKQRMEDAVPMSDGMPYLEICRRLTHII